MMNKKEIESKFASKIFKCHLIMLLVAFIFTFFFGGFLHIEKPVNGYIFSGFMVVGYLFLLYSECLMEARKNFYNANGNRSQIDIFLGVKSAFKGHIFTLVFLFTVLVFYYAYKWTGLSIWIDNTSIYVYLNLFFRLWLLPFLSFFPNTDSIILWLYLIFALFPIPVCGISYYLGIKECKTIND